MILFCNFFNLYRMVVQHAHNFASSTRSINALKIQDYGSKEEIFHGLPFGWS